MQGVISLEGTGGRGVTPPELTLRWSSFTDGAMQSMDRGDVERALNDFKKKKAVPCPLKCFL